MGNINLVTGYYGVGKSEFSVNLVTRDSKNNNLSNKKNIIIDLDVINPYFRSREVESYLKNNKIRLISSSIKNDTLDLPAISPEIRSVLRNNMQYDNIVIDLGGDVVGLNVINSLKDSYRDRDVKLFYVINVNRIKVDSYEKIYTHVKSIEKKLHAKVNYLVNNTHMLGNSTMEDIQYGNKMAVDIANLIKLQEDKIINSFDSDLININNLNVKGVLFPMKILLRKEWMN